MAQAKILVDTNAYLRLAQTIRPLLFIEFGEQQYCLYVLPELNRELSNRRLASKFPWVQEEEYSANRQYFPKLSRIQKKNIEQNFTFVWDHVLSELPGPSKVDALYIAYAIELSIPIVTDDQDMTELAVEFDVKIMSTLSLLKVMYDCGHCQLQMIKGIVDFWQFTGDCPANLLRDLKLYFPTLAVR